MKKHNNAGFSLVELIVTILIMGILAAGITVAVVAMHRADADKEASKIANVLEKGRILALSSKDEVYVQLYSDADGNHIELVQGGVATIVDLDDKATVAYMPHGGVETTLPPVSAPVKITFSKSSGAFNSPYVDYIKVTADKDLYVCLVADTGRCYIDTTY